MDTTVKIFVTNSAVEERDRNLQVSIGCLLCARASHCAKKQLGINPVQRSCGGRPETVRKSIRRWGNTNPGV